jgi:hypothetical protein
MRYYVQASLAVSISAYSVQRPLTAFFQVRIDASSPVETSRSPSVYVSRAENCKKCVDSPI